MSKDSDDTKIKTNPYLPKDGSEDPRTLLVPLQNFQLRHDTFQEPEKKDNSKENNDFIGRKSLLKQLEEVLKNTKGNRGSYLIAGYRGSGKTSLMNRVLNKYKEGKKETLIVRINLGHDEVLDTRHVLFNIISSLRHEFNLYFLINKKFLPTFILGCIVILGCFFLINSHLELSPIIQDNMFKNKHKELIDLLFWPLLFFIVLIFCLGFNKVRGFILDLILLGKFNTRNKSIFFLSKKIQILHDRVAYSFEKERGFLNIRSGFGLRNKTNIPEMKEPQIELEIINILERCLDTNFDIIFVFDELDKISLSVSDYNTHQEIGSAKQRITDHIEDETIDESAYRRKKRVDTLLSSLKTLITTGKARFFL